MYQNKVGKSNTQQPSTRPTVPPRLPRVSPTSTGTTPQTSTSTQTKPLTTPSVASSLAVQPNKEAEKLISSPSATKTPPPVPSRTDRPALSSTLKEQQSLGGSPNQLTSFLENKRQDGPVSSTPSTLSSNPSPSTRPTPPARPPRQNVSTQPSAEPTPMPQSSGPQTPTTTPPARPPRTQVTPGMQATSSTPSQTTGAEKISQAPSKKPPAVPPRQELESLVGDVASGKLKGYDAIYDRYSHADNAFQNLDAQGYKTKIAALNSPVTGSPSIQGSKTGENYIQYTLAGSDMQQRTKERVYVHAKSDHAPDVMQHLLSQQMSGQNTGVTAAKIWNHGEITKRNDGIVVYTEGGKSTQDVLQSLKGYQQTNPSHFGSSTPMMTHKHGNGLSTGPDPKQGGSFGSVRADAITRASESPDVLVHGQIDRVRLQAKTDEFLRQAGVDPLDPSKDL